MAPSLLRPLAWAALTLMLSTAPDRARAELIFSDPLESTGGWTVEQACCWLGAGAGLTPTAGSESIHFSNFSNGVGRTYRSNIGLSLMAGAYTIRIDAGNYDNLAFPALGDFGGVGLMVDGGYRAPDSIAQPIPDPGEWLEWVLDYEVDDEDSDVGATLGFQMQMVNALPENGNMTFDRLRIEFVAPSGPPLAGQLPGSAFGSLAAALDAAGESPALADLLATLAAIEDPAALERALAELSPARLEGSVRSVRALSNQFHRRLHFNVAESIPTRLAWRGIAPSRHASLLGAFRAVDPPKYMDALPPVGAGLPEFGEPLDEAREPTERELAEVSARAGGWHAFAESHAGYASEESHGTRVGQRWWATGLQAGADYALRPDVVAGLAAGYLYTDSDKRGTSGKGNVHSLRVGPYLGFAREGLVLDAGTSFGMHWIDDSHRVLGGGTTRSEHETWDVAAHGSLRVDWKTGGFRFGPLAQVHFVRVEERGYTERAGIAPLRMPARDTDSLSSTVGMHAAWAPAWTELDLGFDGELGWVHEYRDDADTLAARFAGAPVSGFGVRLPGADRDAARLTLAADLALGDDWRIRVGWTGTRSSHVEAHTGSLRLELSY